MKKVKIFFVILLFPIVAWISCSNNKQPETEKKSSPLNAKTYSIYVVKEQALSNTLRLPAQLNAYEAINIYPKVTGYVKKIHVDIGTQVAQGQIIMEMEAPEVEQNDLAAHEKYNKAVAAFNASRDGYYRLLNTSKTVGAVSPNDLQAAQSEMQSDSAFCNSEKAYWKAMQSMKEYLIIKAPFSGTITQRNIHTGALVAVGNKMDSKPLLELQQISRLRLQVKVPESYATQLEVNHKISFVVDAIPGKTFIGTICRQSHSLDEKYRSEIVELDVYNHDNVLMPGMYAEVLLPLKGHANACNVPQSAVVTSTEKKYVIKVSNNKAVLVNITTGNEDKGMVEIFGDVKSGDSVIEKASEEIVQDQSIVTTK